MQIYLTDMHLLPCTGDAWLLVTRPNMLEQSVNYIMYVCENPLPI